MTASNFHNLKYLVFKYFLLILLKVRLNCMHLTDKYPSDYQMFTI